VEPEVPAAVDAGAAVHGRLPTGACQPGFSPLVRAPGGPKDPCYRSCTSNLDCTGGEVCSGEEAYVGHRMVCEPPDPKVALPARTTDRFPRARDADGPCPPNFLEVSGTPAVCARICKSDADCHGHRCAAAESGPGKVCQEGAVAGTCKGNEVPAGENGACVKQCSVDADCGKGQACLPASFIDPSAGEAHVRACFATGPAEKPTASAYKVGDAVNVEWKGATYPATILSVPAANQYKIHYDGYASSWDEVVGPARIRGRR
jgi:hypothetical protein